MRKGFTIIEIIATLGLLLFGIVAALSAVTYTVRASTDAGHRLTATFLASEGLELMHNARDNDRMVNPPTTIAPDNYDVAPNGSTILLRSATSTPLLYDSGTGLYGYSSGSATAFHRTVTVTASSLGEDHLIVTSRVTWDNGNHAVSLTTHLYDWRL